MFCPVVFAGLYGLLVFLAGCGAHVHHRVEKGETLYSIGFYYGHDYQDIAKWNNIPAPYLIKEGQWLIVAPPENKEWEGGQNQTPSTLNKHNNNSSRQSSKTGNNTNNRPVKSQTEVTEDFTDRASPVSKWSWPTQGSTVEPIRKFSKHSKGIDIAGQLGQPVYSTAAGKVVYSGSGLIGYGKLIIVKHNKTYLSAYAHNQQMLVKEGDIVKQGQQIAKMGKSPQNSVMLHFEIRRNGKPIDPLSLLERQFR